MDVIVKFKVNLFYVIFTYSSQISSRLVYELRAALTDLAFRLFLFIFDSSLPAAEICPS